MIATHRLVSAGLVALWLLAALWLEPQPADRATLHYRLIIALGYGHLIGAAWRARHRLRARAGRDAARRRAAQLAAGVSAALPVYVFALASLPSLVLPLLAISAWHTVENEGLLARTRRAGPGRAPPRATFDDWLATCAWTGFVMLLSAATLGPADLGPAMPADVVGGYAVADLAIAIVRGASLAAAGLLVLRGPTPARVLPTVALLILPVRLVQLGSLGSLGFLSFLGFADVFAALTGLHLVSWLVFLHRRARDAGGDAPARLWREIAATHAPPAVLCGLLSTSAGDAAPGLAALVFSPPIYLFWSTLHVVQTAWTRRDARQSAATSASGNGSQPVPGQPDESTSHQRQGIPTSDPAPGSTWPT